MKLLEKQENVEQATKASKSKKRKLEPVSMKDLLQAWKKNMLATKDELEMQLEDITNNDADTSEESYCISKILDWQKIMLFATHNTYQIIPFLVRLEGFWKELTKGSMTFIEYLKEKRITFIDEKMVKDWKNVYFYVIADYPMFKYLKINMRELTTHAKEINAYLKSEKNRQEALFWSTDTIYGQTKKSTLKIELDEGDFEDEKIDEDEDRMDIQYH